MRRALRLLTFSSAAFFAGGVALAQEPTPSPVPESPQEQLNLEFPGVLTLVVVVALVWTVPILFDMWKAYRIRGKDWVKLVDKLIDKASLEGLSAEELRELTTVLGGSPAGITGLARTLMALTVATILFVTVIVLVLTATETELLKTVVTALTTAFATIVGFYFGARTAETTGTSPPGTGQQGTGARVGSTGP